MDIYVIDYDVLRETKDDAYNDLYESIPLCYKNRSFINMFVESIPREKEILLIRKEDSIVVMYVFKVVYFERKVFVIVKDTDGNTILKGKIIKRSIK